MFFLQSVSQNLPLVLNVLYYIIKYCDGDTATSLGLTGKEKFDIDLPADLTPGQKIEVTTDTGAAFKVVVR